MERLKSETSFMSEQASLFLLSVGLLGEYCPPQRKKDRNSAPLVGCMPLKSHKGHKVRSEDCQFPGPAPFLWNSYNFEGVTLTEQDASLAY